MCDTPFFEASQSPKRANRSLRKLKGMSYNADQLLGLVLGQRLAASFSVCV